MKRIIVALLAVLMVFGLASCNDNPNNVGLIIGNQTSSTKKATAVAEGIADNIANSIASGAAGDSTQLDASEGTATNTSSMSLTVSGETFTGDVTTSIKANDLVKEEAPSTSIIAYSADAPSMPNAPYVISISGNLTSGKGNTIGIGALYTADENGTITGRQALAMYNGTSTINLSSSIFDEAVNGLIAYTKATKAVADLGNSIKMTSFFGDLFSALKGIKYPTDLATTTPDDTAVDFAAGASNNLSIDISKYNNSETVTFGDLQELVGGPEEGPVELPIEFTVSFSDSYSNGMHNSNTAIGTTGSIVLATTLNITKDSTTGSVASITGFDVTVNDLAYTIDGVNHKVTTSPIDLTFELSNLDLKAPSAFNPSNTNNVLFDTSTDFTSALATVKITSEDIDINCDGTAVAYAMVKGLLDDSTTIIGGNQQ